jgi:XTP/dITP diphosphohydrolase
MENASIPTIPIIVVATMNKGKLKEFRELLKPLNAEILGLEDVGAYADVEESGSNFAENARIKALAYSKMTEHPVLADDSGLEVKALGGQPGIHSARYAGPGASDQDRINKLLDELEKAGGSRDARFFCALAVAHNDAIVHEANGECAGVMTDAPRGDNGFGYDPIFLVPALGKTYAELSKEEKDALSHRARAVAALLQQLGINAENA